MSTRYLCPEHYQYLKISMKNSPASSWQLALSISGLNYHGNIETNDSIYFLN